MATYLIKLYPIERFFFGSDQTFGKDNENYFVRSVYFPQQTTLLGTLRYYLLQQNDKMNEYGKTNPDGKRLIGNMGFDAEIKADVDFGIIKKLSPVFITGPDGEYMVQSREYGYNWIEDEITREKQRELTPLLLSKRKGTTSFGDNEINEIHYLEGLTSKTEIPDLLVNVKTGRIRHFDFKDELSNNPTNGVFIPHEQVGIRKPRKEDIDKNKGFYKQIGYTMKPGYGFAFYAQLDPNEEKGDKIGPGLVKMGADQSWFRVECKIQASEIESNMLRLTRNLYNRFNKLENKIVLLSDTYIDWDLYNSPTIPLASVVTVPFRYLITNRPKQGAPEYDFKRAELKLRKTTKYRTLLKKGSVLFLANNADKQQLIKQMQSNKAFLQIGYNYAI